MTELLDGKKIAQEIVLKLKQKIRSSNLNLRMGIVLVGNDPASLLYTLMKLKRCEEIGIVATRYTFSDFISETELLEKMFIINKENDGVIVQLPLPQHLSQERILESIDSSKDIDGLTMASFGDLIKEDIDVKTGVKTSVKRFIPATPKGIMRLLDEYHISVQGKNVVIINHSNLIGKPLALLLLQRNATVTVCHAYTKSLEEFTKNADILITAVGKAGLITKMMVKEGVVIIDAGVAKIGDKMCGDVEFERVKEKASFITPVPGGVGPMTIAMLLENLVENSKVVRTE